MDRVEVTARVPIAFVERMRELAEASGVTLEAFVCASFEARTAEHQGRDRLSDELLERARKYL